GRRWCPRSAAGAWGIGQPGFMSHSAPGLPGVVVGPAAAPSRRNRGRQRVQFIAHVGRSKGTNLADSPGGCAGIEVSGEEAPMAQITLAKALKLKNRLAGRLAKVQADIQAYNSVPEGQADQVNVPALLRTREELVGALVALKTAINDANREVQRD